MKLMTRIAQSVVIIALVILAGKAAFFIFASLAQSNRPNKNPSLVNIKQLATATLAYSAGYDDKLPPDMRSGHTAWPYIKEIAKNPAILDTLNPGSPEWLGNSLLSNQVATDPSSTLLFFDSAPRRTNVRLTAFLDSHVKPIAETRFQTAIANRFVLPAKP